jgi:hypothetical protein
MARQSKLMKRSYPLLAMGALGASCVWSTEMAFASPFLLHLGVSKSNMAIVFVAGPLSGLIVQPAIGQYERLPSPRPAPLREGQSLISI